MPSVVAAIVVAWSVLLGSAYLSRVVWRLGRRSCAAAVLGCYALLCAPTLAWFGLTATGLAAVAGLALPCAAGLALVRFPPGR